ncbi:MAG: CDP-alcohol phosphatidyltransferase family protein [Candidatus Gracilibacteria bacterium]|nr:CDP-alcohol phosphatidyltransferase family protein [Candidatus Gracilibacteria bacterium]
MKNKETLNQGGQNKIKSNLDKSLGVLTSGVKKSIDFIINYGSEIKDKGLKNAEFLDSLNKAGITPNNITTFRLFTFGMGVLMYELGHAKTGLSMMTLSCVLDVVDGKLARKYHQKSKGGETFDAGLDKTSDILLTTLATISLSEFSSIEALINGLIGIAKADQHKESQFRPGRPGLDEQLEIFTESILEDENTQYIKKPTPGAANKYGKYKTAMQFTSGLGILWTQEVNKLISMGVGKDVLEVVFIALSGVSVVLAQKSINGTNEKK